MHPANVDNTEDDGVAVGVLETVAAAVEAGVDDTDDVTVCAAVADTDDVTVNAGVDVSAEEGVGDEIGVASGVAQESQNVSARLRSEKPSARRHSCRSFSAAMPTSWRRPAQAQKSS